MSTYTIGEVSQRTGFSASALRYYEQHGLLDPTARTDAGYRLYDNQSLARLRFIDRAKKLGCTLEEIADLAKLWEADDCGPVQARLHTLVSAKIADARRRSTELITFTAQLQTAAAHLGNEPVDGPCHTGCACVTDPTGAQGTETTPIMVGRRAESAIACTLPSARMPERMEHWQAVLVHVTEREPIADVGVRLSLDGAVPLDELTRLAAAEQGCCAFLAFAITIDDRGIGLEVRAPDDAADIVTAMFEVAS